MALALYVATVVLQQYVYEVAFIGAVTTLLVWTSLQLYLYGPDDDVIVDCNATKEMQSRRRLLATKEAALIQSVGALHLHDVRRAVWRSCPGRGGSR